MKTKILISEETKTSIYDGEYNSQTYFVMESNHYNGRYKVYVGKETHERNLVSTLLYADGNFNVTLGNGRKSQKKIDKVQSIIEDNKNNYFELWNNREYSKIAEDLQAKTSSLFK